MSKIFFLLAFLSLVQIAYADQKDTLSQKQNQTSVRDLALTLCRDTKNDQERVTNIYTWVTNSIAWEAKNSLSVIDGTYASPEQVLKLKTANPMEFALLMKSICEFAGIKTFIITGYHKNEYFLDGFTFHSPNHAWNAVFVNQKWQILDAYLGAGDSRLNQNLNKNELLNALKSSKQEKNSFRQHPNPQYLFQNPKEVLMSRIPADPVWQFMEPICTLEAFEKNATDNQDFISKLNHYNYNSEIPDHLYKLSIEHRLLAAADRMFQFNPKWFEIKIEKNLTEVQHNIALLSEAEADESLIQKKINTLLENSTALLNERKKEISKQYMEYRKILANQKSNLARYRQSITSHNSKLLSLLSAKSSAARAKMEKIGEDSKNKINKKQDIDASHFMNAKTLSPEKPANDPVVKILNDSIQFRSKQITKMKNEIQGSKDRIAADKLQLNILNDSLNVYFNRTDSTFFLEALNERFWQNSLKDSVTLLRDGFFYNKIIKQDRFQNEYLILFDSILLTYDKIRRTLSHMIDDSKKNTKDLESLKRNRNQANLINLYNTYAQEYNDAIRIYVNNNLSLENFLQTQIDLLEQQKKKYQDQNQYFELQNILETHDKEALKKMIERTEEIDKEWNEKQADMIEKTREKMHAELRKSEKKKKTKSKDEETNNP